MNRRDKYEFVLRQALELTTSQRCRLVLDVCEATIDSPPDFLDEMIAEATDKDPNFPSLLADALHKYRHPPEEHEESAEACGGLGDAVWHPEETK